MSEPYTTDLATARARRGNGGLEAAAEDCSAPRPAGLTFDEAIAIPVRALYHVKHLCAPGEITLIFGESGSYKSFIVTDAGLTVAAGAPRWFGARVNAGAVLFIVGEGSAGIAKRWQAWSQERGDVRGLPVFLWPYPVDLFEGPGPLVDVLAHAEQRLGRVVSLVVIDPLGLMFGRGGDESSNGDAGRVFTNVRTALGPDRGALATHHSGHSDKGRERGASTLRTNADRRFLVEFQDGDAPVVTIANLKEKDDAESDRLYLAPRVVTLGADADGDPITSVVLETTVNRPAEATKWKGALSKRDLDGLKVLRQLHQRTRLPIHVGAWFAAMQRKGLAGEAQGDTALRTCRRIAKALRDAEQVETIGVGRSTSYAPIGKVDDVEDGS